MIPTTYEMDGLFTEEDIKNRNSVMVQCSKCNKWTKQTDYLLHHNYVPCSNCGEIAYDARSIKSIRTYNPLTDGKRRPGKREKS